MQSYYVGSEEIGKSFIKLRAELVNKLVSFYPGDKFDEQSGIGLNTKENTKRFSVDKCSAEIIVNVLQKYATDFCKGFGYSGEVCLSHSEQELVKASSVGDSNERKAEFVLVLDEFFINLCNIAAKFKAEVGSEKFEDVVKECNNKIDDNLKNAVRLCSVFGTASLKSEKTEKPKKPFEKKPIISNKIKQQQPKDLSHLFGPGSIPERGKSNKIKQQQPKDLSHLFRPGPIPEKAKSDKAKQQKSNESISLWDYDNWDNWDNSINSGLNSKDKDINKNFK